jgi:prolipoprotein diacylglyceryl transferase
MLAYPDIDPVALALGPLRIHWYGLMYLVGFAAFWALGRWRAARPGSGWDARMVDDVLFYGVVGTIVGGRLGYMLFYGSGQIAADPLSLLRVWEGGMAFHGGLIGVLVAMWLFARRHRMRFFAVTDFVAPLVPLGLMAGRIGNFINGELWGHVSPASPGACACPATGSPGVLPRARRGGPVEPAAAPLPALPGGARGACPFHHPVALLQPAAPDHGRLGAVPARLRGLPLPGGARPPP